MDWTEKAARGALMLLPGAALVYLSFNGGGFFPNTPAFVAILLIEALVLRVTLADDPAAGMTPPVLVAAAALAVYAGWTLLSATWSHSTARALIEFDRALLYLLVVVLMGSVVRRPGELRWTVRVLVIGLLVVCGAGLISRILPDVLPTGSSIASDRLSYPLTYWNALGLMAALGFILSLHLASDDQEPPLVRVLAMVGPPVFAATAFFTFSRGSVVAGVIGTLVYACVARPRALLNVLLVTVPATVIVLIAAYGADQLDEASPSVAAIPQGKHVATVLALCVLGSLLARGLLLPLDRSLARLALPPNLRVPVFATVAVVAMVAIGVFTAAAHVPHYVSTQYDRFVEGTPPKETKGLRQRFTDPSSNGRLRNWRVAVDSFDRSPFEGSGAGTYVLVWARHRDTGARVTDAHSLYLEVAGELGIVGILALLIAIGSIFIGLAVQARGQNRGLYAALIAAGVAWALHAGVDWDWEMPAATLWFFAVGSRALAARKGAPAVPRNRRLPILLGLALLVSTVLPVLITLSQGRLDDSGDAFRRGDCQTAHRQAVRSLRVFATRSEPYEILAYCNLRNGAPRQALEAMREALRRDPDNWGYHYGMAVALAANGKDPRREARLARKLNPREPIARRLPRRFATSSRSRWRTEAERARFAMVQAGLLTFE
jgi:hypothetical protein